MSKQIAKVGTKVEAPAKEEATVAETNTGVEVKTEAPAKAVVLKTAFGARVGTKTATMEQALTKNPQTMAELLEATGLRKTMYNHLNGLARQGKIGKSRDGYFLLDS